MTPTRPRSGLELMLCAVALLCMTARARAFSDSALFALPTAQAGGAGRYFTGSPADGYTCKVCHQGGTEPALTVSGLPVGVYVPSYRYEVIVDWPDAIDKFSAALEITDRQGKRAGTLRLPPQAELLTPEFCEPATDAIPAASLNVAGDRQVITVPDCGAKRMRFLWTAPSSDVGPVWLAGSAVHSDGNSDVLGDGVTDLSRIVGSASSASVTASNTTGGCSAGGGAADGGGAALLLPLLAWLLFSRRQSSGTTSWNLRRSSTIAPSGASDKTSARRVFHRMSRAK